MISGCPTATRPVPAREGLLARICVPAGRLAAVQLRGLASGCAELGIGQLDITNRANIQVRGLSATQAEGLARLARDCGLLPGAHAERRRAIVLSPLSGLRGGEELRGAFADAGDLVRQLDACLLASEHADALSPKFGLGIDDGGPQQIERDSLDLVFAVEGGAWRVLLAGCDAHLRAPTDSATAVLETLLVLLAETGAARAKDLLAASGLEFVRGHLVNAGAMESAAPVAHWADAPPPVGIIATGDAHVALGAVARFGVLSIAAALAAATVALESGNGEVRLTPWRGLLLPGLPRSAAEKARSTLDVAGLATEPATPFATIHACAGVQGCLRADLDIRRDALAVAEALATTGLRVRTIHVSGCGRGCAWPRPADVLLLADGIGGYTLRRDADARASQSGVAVARGISPEAAPAAVRALVETLAAERG